MAPAPSSSSSPPPYAPRLLDPSSAIAPAGPLPPRVRSFLTLLLYTFLITVVLPFTGFWTYIYIALNGPSSVLGLILVYGVFFAWLVALGWSVNRWLGCAKALWRGVDGSVMRGGERRRVRGQGEREGEEQGWGLGEWRKAEGEA